VRTNVVLVALEVSVVVLRKGSQQLNKGAKLGSVVRASRSYGGRCGNRSCCRRRFK
jgi:hypothetical protein